jgi:choice-of-anchor B domain-containing protein
MSEPCVESVFDRVRQTAANALSLARCLAALVLAGGSGAALAHGGADEVIHVAEGGVDRGRCLEASAPCRTIAYALAVAGKGSTIQVAPGTYPVAASEDLFYIVSGLIEVVGGVSPAVNGKPQSRGVSVLTGAPLEYRDLLRERGFHVIADRKGIDGPKVAEAEKLLGLQQTLKAGAPASPCVGGTAGELECQAVDLLSHFAFDDVSARPSSANDVWGFVDLNTGREYALMGYNIGTAVIDVTDPESPVEVGFVDGQRATWRDIKVYQFFDGDAGRWLAYAYVTTDGNSDGLFVIDLSNLPHGIRKTAYTSEYVAAHNVYATQTDYRTGIALGAAVPTLIIAGSNLDAGRYRAYTLADPARPEFVAGASTNDYMHDASSIVVTDSRKDTQCDNGGSECEVLLDFNETTIDLWDVTEPSTPVRLSRTSYGDASYVHSGWWAEDRRHIFVHDELDEQQRGLNTTVRVFSVADFTAPVQVGTWTGPTRAIDHNGYVRGNRYYMSNYSRGLTVLDISDPATPVTVGRLDTYPFSNSTAFVGAWGTFPFFAGDFIAISDIDSGLYLARDRSVEVPQGRLAFAAASAGSAEGETAELIVRRIGGTSGDVSVMVEILHATTADDDVESFTDSLAWRGGDGTERTIAIPLANDGMAEGLERLFVRLVDPGGGATLGAPGVASLFASDPGASPAVRLFGDSIAVTERGFGRAVAVLQRTGSALGEVSVDYALGGGNADHGSDFEGPASGTVTWADGDAEPKNLVFDILDDGTGENEEFFELTLGNAGGATLAGSNVLRVTIADGGGSNSAPNAIAGSSQVRASGQTVTLDGSQSNDADGDSLEYAWAQTSGPGVTLSNAGSAIAQFTAPAVDSDTMLQFRLSVTDPGGLGDTSTVTVTVTSGSTSSDSGGSGGGAMQPFTVMLLLLAALCGKGHCIRRPSRRGRERASKSLFPFAATGRSYRRTDAVDYL